MKNNSRENIGTLYMSKGHFFLLENEDRNGILLAKLFWHTVRKKWSSDREKLLIFEAEGQELAKLLRSLKQFIQTVKVQNIFW